MFVDLGLKVFVPIAGFCLHNTAMQRALFRLDCLLLQLCSFS
jgi:hypothetical protein